MIGPMPQPTPAGLALSCEIKPAKALAGATLRPTRLPGWCLWPGVLILVGLQVWMVYDRAAAGEGGPTDRPGVIPGRLSNG